MELAHYKIMSMIACKQDPPTFQLDNELLSPMENHSLPNSCTNANPYHLTRLATLSPQGINGLLSSVKGAN